jgi:hypothetical protein
MLVRILFFGFTYLMIGHSIHSMTQPIASKKPFKRFTKENWITYLLDLIFWFPLVLVFIVLKIIKYFKK